ncbi:hypothetical protein [Gordonibacter sp. Marseille-P4307]|nr:hypothetical protein [Gordonibacter sp. Marseille-P4307]
MGVIEKSERTAAARGFDVRIASSVERFGNDAFRKDAEQVSVP